MTYYNKYSNIGQRSFSDITRHGKTTGRRVVPNDRMAGIADFLMGALEGIKPFIGMIIESSQDIPVSYTHLTLPTIYSV